MNVGQKKFTIFSKRNIFTIFIILIVSYCIKLAAVEQLPAKYDLRDVDNECYLTPVKIQGGIFEDDGQFDVSKSVGICWAFAACAAFESNLLKQGIVNDANSELANLSEWHIGNTTPYNQHIYRYSMDKSPDGIYWGYVRPVYDEALSSKIPVSYMTWGTDPRAAIDYMASGEGPVLEYADDTTQFPLDEVQYCEDLTPPIKNLPADYSLREANIYYSTDYDTYEEYSKVIKRAIIKYGALQTGVHTEAGDYPHVKGNSYIDKKNNTMCTTNPKAFFNHSLSVVGWDDNKIVPAAENDGAWLVKDHSGDEFYEDGFYWISYEDAVFMKKPIIAVAYVASYKNNKLILYQTHKGALSQTSFNKGINSFDYLCDDSKVGEFPAAAAVFTAENDMAIKSIGLVTVNKNEKLKISIYDNWNSEKKEPENLIFKTYETIKIPECGYHVIDFTEKVKIKKGNEFVVTVEFQNNRKNKNDSIVYVHDFKQPVLEGKTFKLEKRKWEDLSEHNFAIDEDNYESAVFYIQVFTENI